MQNNTQTDKKFLKLVGKFHAKTRMHAALTNPESIGLGEIDSGSRGDADKNVHQSAGNVT